jgi:catechol 2,3-dioxygenase-like lactoylglutathione lyase family enzyme
MGLRAELFVADVPRSLDFYTRVLGFKIERNSADYISIRRGHVVFGIGSYTELDPDHYFRPEGGRIRNGIGVEFVLEVDDVMALEREVRAAGYPLIKPIAKQPWCLTDFRLADPDGYFLRVTSRR